MPYRRPDQHELIAANRVSYPESTVNDSRIAATAIANGIPVVTQDGDDDDVPGVDRIRL